LPSVTTVIGAQKKKSIMEWRKRVGEEVSKIKSLAQPQGVVQQFIQCVKIS
jgi:hypothetical protein